MPTPRTLFVVDAHALIHRFYHAPFQQLSGPPGSCGACGGGAENDPEACEWCLGTGREPTKATWQFTKALLALIRERRPTYLAVAADGKRHLLHRRTLCPAYKAQRKPNPPDLKVQLLRCRDIVRALGIPLIQVDGYEADDIMATIARRMVRDDLHIRLVCRDKDMMPLLADPRVKFYDAHEREELGPDWVVRKYGLQPAQVEDYLALVGDTSDNIKGVEGIGDKTAKGWLARYGTIDRMLAEPLFRAGMFATTRKLMDAADDGSLELARKLVRLDDTVPLGVRRHELRCHGVDVRRAAPIFKALGFRRLEQI